MLVVKLVSGSAVVIIGGKLAAGGRVFVSDSIASLVV
jgi:hypothetical protein